MRNFCYVSLSWTCDLTNQVTLLPRQVPCCGINTRGWGHRRPDPTRGRRSAARKPWCSAIYCCFCSSMQIGGEEGFERREHLRAVIFHAERVIGTRQQQ